jgi:hypothetical protein
MYYFERIDRKVANMREMLDRCGIDPADLAQRLGVSFGASVRACQMCSRGEQCQRWLADAGSCVDRIPEFCPNALRFEHAKSVMDDGTRPK